MKKSGLKLFEKILGFIFGAGLFLWIALLVSMGFVIFGGK